MSSSPLPFIPANAPPHVLTKQLAAWLGVGSKTIQRLARDGVLPQPLKLTPRLCYWDTEAVRQALLARLTPVPPPVPESADAPQQTPSAESSPAA